MKTIYNFIRILLQSPMSGRFIRILKQHRPSQQQYNSPLRTIAICNLIPFLGDTIMYLPLIDALKKKWPNTRILYVADTAIASILRAYPGIDEVIVYRGISSRNWVKRIPIFRSYVQLVSMVASFRNRKLEHIPDLALIPRGGPDPFLSAHAAWLLNIPKIYGYNPQVEPERAYLRRDVEALLTRMVQEKRFAHESMRALEVAEIAGLLTSDCWSEFQPVNGLKRLADSQDFSQIADLVGLRTDEAYIVISPGAGSDYRKWPSENFREIAIRLYKEFRIPVLVVGTDAERILATRITTGLEPGIRNVTGKLNLLQLIGLFNKAKLFIGNDSGPGHIAGALGVQTISLNAYPLAASSNHHQCPSRNRPVGPNVAVLRPLNFLPPCHSECQEHTVHCLAQIGVDEVWETILNGLVNTNKIDNR